MLPSSDHSRRALVLRISSEGVRAQTPAELVRPGRARLARFGGTAHALVRLEAELEAGADPARIFVLCAGDAVRRGLPTAARATVMAAAPLAGGLAEGQLGGSLGPALAALADVVLLIGDAEAESSGGHARERVLCLDREGRASVERLEGLAECSPARALALLRERFVDHAVLVTGPAAARGVRFANLAGGHEPPSFVGRGGLGASFAALGLRALVVALPVAAARSSDDERAAGALVAALGRSPRLAARSRSGTLELFHAEAARSASDVDPRAVLASAAAASARRDGCRGCPTPCGWVLRTSLDGKEEGAGVEGRVHFSALRNLGTPLGLDFEGARRVLAAADRIGVDAKELGQGLLLLVRASEAGLVPGPSPRGDVDRCVELTLALAGEAEGDEPPASPPPTAPVGRGSRRAHEAVDGTGLSLPAALGALRRGSQALAAALGKPAWAGIRNELSSGNLAQELGVRVAAAGRDPMRSFPFLVEAGGREALTRIFEGLAWPAGAEDPARAAGKGLLVACQENLVGAVDALGFCAFSMAGLCADAALSLDELAAWLLPAAALAESAPPADPARSWAGLGAGRQLLALGANLVVLRRHLAPHFQAAGGAHAQRPEAPASDAPNASMLAALERDYHRARGLSDDGRPLPELVAALGTPAVLAPLARFSAAESATSGEPRVADSAAEARVSTRNDAQAETDAVARPGCVGLRAIGPLGEALGGANEVELELPASVTVVLAAVAAAHPEAAERIFQGARIVPAVWCAGRRLEPGDTVRDGDRLDLVVAIAGG